MNRKVTITAAHSNKQGDVQVIEFGIPGYDDLVWDVSLVCDRIGSSTQLASVVSCNSVTTLTLGLASRSTGTDVIMLPRTSGKIHPEFVCHLWVLADKLCAISFSNYALIGAVTIRSLVQRRRLTAKLSSEVELAR